MSLPHKDIVFIEVDLSGDEGDPDWNGQDYAPVPNSHLLRWVRPPGLFARVWEGKQESWTEYVAAYEADAGSFYHSWNYLNGHPVYWRFRQMKDRPANHESGLETEYGFGSDAINVFVARVCPECRTSHTDEEAHANSKTEIWLETGKWDLFPQDEGAGHGHWHDYDLDCGADTYEEAVIQLAYKVWTKYGNDRRIADAE